ncbi:MAG: hypothetical protein DME28_10585 [Verrucomicrobia bacterium]|nr:MAG: hypothetical protein DME28_10585 [Verrucomicrobiota bacterium]
MSNSGYLPPVRQWWIGRSAGDAKQMRLRRLNLTSSKGLLDPPILRCLKPVATGALASQFRSATNTKNRPTRCTAKFRFRKSLSSKSFPKGSARPTLPESPQSLVNGAALNGRRA